ncbi:MAG: D-alanyl-D-alanine carboxypeptidase [Chloroflexi bacterium]|nr:MAG: D-alanyl-D-alanine carboxypeptidase [Chloroflexota bacterium]
MSRLFSRLLIVLLGIGAMAGAVGSAAPPQPATAATTTRLLASASLTSAPRPRPDWGELPASPASTPTAVPLTPSPPRPAATLRPIPVPTVDAQEVALVNLDTGRFLWQRNARAGWAPASLTKIFTAMVATDLMGMNTLVTVPASINQLPPDSTVMGLTAGERLTVRELLYGVFLDSGNDAAETLATAVTSRSTFIADMNVRVLRLGLRTTHFVNPTGLDAAGHYSSANDLAVATMYLESHYPGLVAIAATSAIAIPATPTHKAFALVNLDKLLHTYPGTYGLKTGWTDAALGCLISTSSRGGHRLLAVLLGAPAGTAYEEMPKVLDYGFELLGILPRPPA